MQKCDVDGDITLQYSLGTAQWASAKYAAILGSNGKE